MGLHYVLVSKAETCSLPRLDVESCPKSLSLSQSAESPSVVRRLVDLKECGGIWTVLRLKNAGQSPMIWSHKFIRYSLFLTCLPVINSTRKILRRSSNSSKLIGYGCFHHSIGKLTHSTTTPGEEVKEQLVYISRELGIFSYSCVYIQAPLKTLGSCRVSAERARTLPLPREHLKGPSMRSSSLDLIFCFEAVILLHFQSLKQMGTPH